MAAVNDDYTGLDYSYQEPEATQHRELIQKGLGKWGPYLTMDNGHDEFSSRKCDCCGTHLAGERHHFVVLGN